MHLLTRDASVMVWYRLGERDIPYKGKLTEEVAGGLWVVKWSRDPENTQRFNPLHDPWILSGESRP